jgi:hypothetical protein
MTEFINFAQSEPTRWVFHNGLGYDVWVINRLVKADLINPKDIVDTAVVSRTVDYYKYNTHSLRELGEALGVYKGEYEGDWEICTPEMITYGEQDVEVLEAVFNHFKKVIYDKDWAKALRVEHDMAIICAEMNQNGFYFDIDTAEAIQRTVRSELDVINKALQEAFPPQLVEVNRLKYRVKKDGTKYKNVEEAEGQYPLVKIEDTDLVCYDYEPFDPASPQKRIDILWDAGWKPTEMTDGHKKFLREQRR